MTGFQLHVPWRTFRAVPRRGPLDHAGDDHDERRCADHLLIECRSLERDAQIRIAEECESVTRGPVMSKTVR